VYDFIVTLRSGLQLTVRADRLVVSDPQFIALVAGPPDDGEGPLANAVALFERGQVAFLVARKQLLSEKKGKAIVSPHAIVHDDSDIPF